MRIIRKEILLALLLMFSCSPLVAAGFIEYCARKEKTAEQVYTLDVLGNLAGDRSCDKIKAMLEFGDEFELVDPDLVDVHVFTYFSNLIALYLTSHRAINLDQLKSMNNLVHIRIHAPLEKVERLPLNIEYLWIFGAPKLELPAIASYSRLLELHVYDSALPSSDILAGTESLDYLALLNTGLATIDAIPTLQNLTGIDFSNNSLKSISGISRFRKLTDLYVSRNSISDITELKKLPALDSVNISYTNVSDFRALAEIPTIAYLTIDGLGLTEIPNLGAKDGLKRLSIRENSVSDISILAQYPSLKELAIGYNNLTHIDVVGKLTNLNRLWAQGNKILEISSLPGKLYQLDIDDNGMASLEWLNGQSLPNLHFINFSNNAISDIRPLGNFAKLYNIVFNRNRVKSLNGIEELSNLVELEANGNEISDITALGKNQHTQIVFLNGNQISDASSLADMSNLRYIEMSDNPLGTSIPKTEENCPTEKGPWALNDWCSQKLSPSH